MSEKEIHVAMRRVFAGVRKEDVRWLARAFEKRKLIFCLTPRELTGKVHFPTPKGQKVLRKELAIPVHEIPPLVNWAKYAALQRAQVRKLVLIAVGRPLYGMPSSKTAGVIRKRVAEEHPIGSGALTRATSELLQMKLIQRVGVAKNRQRALYSLTISGRRIYSVLTLPQANPPQELHTVWQQSLSKDSSNLSYEKEIKTKADRGGTECSAAGNGPENGSLHQANQRTSPLLESPITLPPFR
jgi:DNA-binding MarR family transcriptional regulator